MDCVITKTPGKLILSGEYAVLKGAPCIAFAVNQFLITTLCKTPGNRIVELDLPDTRIFKKTSLDSLRQKARLIRSTRTNHQSKQPIGDFFPEPESMIEYIIGDVLNRFFPNVVEGFTIKIQSNIPIGSGMGSSASMIVGVTQALFECFNLHLDDSKSQILHQNLENFKHGRSSGVDPYVVAHGGVAIFTPQSIHSTPVFKTPLWLLNTGKPETSTGECVPQVLETFKNNPTLIKHLESTTKDVISAWKGQDIESLKTAIQKNHRLLCNLGVVPTAVQETIQKIEQQGLAAKTCGAGSIRGDQGGIVLVIGGKPKGFDCTPIHICEKGARTVHD
jgi:mevalonate kinase